MNRSLIYVKPLDPDQDGNPVAEFACDCGDITEVTLVMPCPLTKPAELAFTCKGCLSAHWFTVAPLMEQTP